MSLPTDLVAFFEEHRRCGKLDGGVEGERVWMTCDCGAQLARVVALLDCSSKGRSASECGEVAP